ncbi:GntR family transcriptional regulator [Phytohabitans suffuscus]|uniref:GntR family transcriptional regulator n=1 Tax=Phytohabitans suffuscus TaxID=624315 RepID=A0A6F8Z1F3_9ACTN|nr:GntR family transcriptional regulator [Phytohabitans suffuscus]
MLHSVFRPVRTRRPFEEAVAQIADAIRAGDLGLGDRLPPERTLATQLDISRPTLREAVKVLVNAGVLDVKPGPAGGIFVRSDVIPREVNAEDWQVRIGEVTDLLEARRLIQPRVAQLAGLRATESDFETMSTTLDLLARSMKDRNRFLQLDERFQLSIARAAHNRVLLEQMRHLLYQLRSAKDYALRDGISDSQWALDSLNRLLKAIMRRDPRLIEREMDEHLSYLEQLWAEETSRAQVREIPEFMMPFRERKSAPGG